MTDQPPAEPGLGKRLPELELLLVGERPLVMFVDTFPSTNPLPEDVFKPHVDSGDLVMRDEIIPGQNGEMGLRYLYYARPKTAAAIADLHGINMSILTENRQPTKDENLKIGRLLGFSDAEIEDLLQWWENQQSIGES